MRSVKEFLFISKKCGIFFAIFYLLHKTNLKIATSRLGTNWTNSKTAWLQKISAALFYYENKVAKIDNRDYLQMKLDESASVYLRPYTSDKDVYQQVFVNEDYKSVVDIYEQIFHKAPESIIDCGSNIGLTTIYFKKKYPEAISLAIEPFPDNFELMKLNFQGSNLANYKALEGGVWNEDNRLSISREFRDGKEWSINLEVSENGKGEIQAYSILDIIRKHTDVVDILKIDVEGTERILFSDLEYARQFLKTVKCIAIEIHDEFNCRDKVYEAFKASNFFYYNVSDMTIAINRSFMN